jgi:hypothetical protein
VKFSDELKHPNRKSSDFLFRKNKNIFPAMMKFRIETHSGWSGELIRENSLMNP